MKVHVFDGTDFTQYGESVDIEQLDDDASTVAMWREEIQARRYVWIGGGAAALFYVTDAANPDFSPIAGHRAAMLTSA